MAGHPLHRYLWLGFALVLLPGLATAVVCGHRATAALAVDARKAEISAEARLFAILADAPLAAWRDAHLRAQAQPLSPEARQQRLHAQQVLSDLCRRAADHDGRGVRYVLIDPAYGLVADSLPPRSDAPPAVPGAPGAHTVPPPEITEAFAGRAAHTTRPSVSAQGALRLYATHPFPLDDGRFLAVLVSRPVVRDSARLADGQRFLTLGAGLATALAWAVAVVLTRRVTRPLRALEHAAGQLALGELDTRLPTTGIFREFNALARALNQMASRLATRLHAARRSDEAHREVLAAMSEGIVSISSTGRVLGINPAAEYLFGLRNEAATGLLIDELSPHPALRALAYEALRAADTPGAAFPPARDVRAGARGERLYEIAPARLNDDGFDGHGTLLVIRDITALRNAESVRKEFVANVSHELRTPVTAIKGFAETLLDECAAFGETAPSPPPHPLPDAGAPPLPLGEWRAFLEVIVRHADRLEQLIGDLLLLSRFERDTAAGQAPGRPTPPGAIARGACATIDARARERRVTLDVRVADGLPAPRVEQRLVEIAVFHMLDNAVRHTEPGGTVRLDVRPEDPRRTVNAGRTQGADNTDNRQGTDEADGVVFSVTDPGPGIPPQYHERVFDRFFRVEDAGDDASPAPDGTGLGLAIVKRIAGAYGGRVDVRSVVGRGSVFSLWLPARCPPPDGADASVPHPADGASPPTPPFGPDAHAS